MLVVGLWTLVFGAWSLEVGPWQAVRIARRRNRVRMVFGVRFSVFGDQITAVGSQLSAIGGQRSAKNQRYTFRGISTEWTASLGTLIHTLR